MRDHQQAWLGMEGRKVMTTKIEWTKNADGSKGETWNPLSGCSRKSAGCEHCYAETMTKRLEAMGQAKYAELLNAQGRFNGTVRLDHDALSIPLKRKKPTTYFVNSMSDLFHENVTHEWIDKIFAVMALCPQHTFQILTKRADRMRDYFRPIGDVQRSDFVLSRAATLSVVHQKRLNYPTLPLSNVWLGVSVENQKAADERIPHLIDTPAAIRFISAEPLLGPLDLFAFKMALDWVIVGGESGANARPCHQDWIRSIVDQCKTANVAVFVKQLGSNSYFSGVNGEDFRETIIGKANDPSRWAEKLRVREMPQVIEEAK